MVSGDTAPQYDRSALVTIDVQRDFLDGQPFEINGTSAALPAMGRLVESFRLKARPIIHMVRLYRADGSNVEPFRRRVVEHGAQLVLPGSGGSQLAAPLLITPDTPAGVDHLQAKVGRLLWNQARAAPARVDRLHLGVCGLQLSELPSRVNL